MSNIIKIDPFFDGENGFTGGTAPDLPVDNNELAGPQPALLPTAPVQGTTSQKASTTAAANTSRGYHSAAALTLVDGRPMAAGMRPGPLGRPGVVIPRAGMGGTPAGVRIHDTGELEVNIDPHMEGQRTRLKLRDITPARLAKATQAAQEVTPEPTTYETMRLRGAAILHGVATLARNEQQAPPAAPVQVATMTAPLHKAAAQPAPSTRQVSPLQAFKTQAAQPPVTNQTPAGLPSMLPAVQPPRVLVTFEIENYGQHRTRYHAVVVEPGFLVLVAKITDNSDDMYTPPAGENTPPMALHIEGTDVVYLVHTTGIVYSHENTRFCVLMIENTAPLVQGE